MVESGEFHGVQRHGLIGAGVPSQASTQEASNLGSDVDEPGVPHSAGVNTHIARPGFSDPRSDRFLGVGHETQSRELQGGAGGGSAHLLRDDVLF